MSETTYPASLSEGIVTMPEIKSCAACGLGESHAQNGWLDVNGVDWHRHCFHHFQDGHFPAEPEPEMECMERSAARRIRSYEEETIFHNPGLPSGLERKRW